MFLHSFVCFDYPSVTKIIFRQHNFPTIELFSPFFDDKHVKKLWLCGSFPSKWFSSANLLSIVVFNVTLFENKKLDTRSLSSSCPYQFRTELSYLTNTVENNHAKSLKGLMTI